MKNLRTHICLVKLCNTLFISLFFPVVLLIVSSGCSDSEQFIKKAIPVWAEGREKEMNLTLGFRGAFEAKEKQNSVLRITASSLYRVHLNGEFIGYGPARAAHGYFRVDEYDLSKFLADGESLISIEVAGYNVNSYYTLDHTEKALYTTHGLSRILQIIRCGARSHNHWVTISDEFGGPHQFRGGSELRKNPQVDKNRKALYNLKDDPDKWFKTPGYYTFAQLSKFVKRDAVLIDSNDTGELLTNAAFKNPEGSIVLVVSNSCDKEASFIISAGGRQAQVTLPADAAGTYIFK